MHWKRRRPKWPYLAALGCLFALTLLAPRSWQRLRTEQEAASGARSATPSVTPAAAPSNEEPGLPTLPPLANQALTFAEPTAAEPTLAEPVVAADDYVADEYIVVDEPLEPAPASDPPSPAPEARIAGDGDSSTVAESLTLRSPGRSVLVRNVAAPKLPRLPAFDLKSMTEVRDAILAYVHRAGEQAKHTAEPAPAPLRVVVESENDRLAMIPNRAEFIPHPAAASTPDLAPLPAMSPPVLRHRPEALIEQLENLASYGPASPWAQHVLARVDQLSRAPADDRPSWEPTIAELRVLAQQGFNESTALRDAAAQTAWLRTSRALDRRLPVWSLLVDREFVQDAEQSPLVYDGPDGDLLIQALHEIAGLTAGSDEGGAWRTYLRIDELAALTSIGGQDHREIRRATARDVLMRMNDPWLTAEQREYLNHPPMATLARELRPWASGETSLDGLAGLIERFEANGSRRDAAAIAELRVRMKWSDDQRLAALAEDLDRHYRNANLRVAFSGELFNRMIPEQQPKIAPVKGRIAGAAVHGRSQTKTEVRLRLLPDPTVWRFGLEAFGDVRSQTTSDTWPAQVRNSSRMQYEVRKLIMLNRYGLHVWPAEAQTQGRTDLVGVDSGLKLIPIVGAIVDGAAREQHRQSRSAAIAQVKNRVSREARERMDAEANLKVRNLEDRFRTYVLEPLERFELTAEPIDMCTSDQRATMRLRLAGEQQLAAHTPRPSAPSDSLASMQLHESALNNALRGLGLDGKRMTVSELHALLSAKIRRHAAAEPADLPRAAKVEFAPHDAVRIACHGDQIELVLNIVELRHGRDSIRNVGVHAFFRPVVDGLEVKLVREGTLQFDGAHLRTGPRMVLHSVFGKLLRKEHEVPVLVAPLREDARFAGLMVTQLVIDDGWLALSVGPATADRTAWRTRGVEHR